METESVKPRGFTILELIIVLAIVCGLVMGLMPIFKGSRETARRTGCGNNLREIGVALHMYAEDYAGRFPAGNNNFRVVYQYIKNRDIILCPSDPFRPQDDESADRPMVHSSYVYKGGLTNEMPGDTLMGGEARAWHKDKVNVLFLDGHVKAIPAEGYKPVVPPSKNLSYWMPIESSGSTYYPSSPSAPPGPPAPPAGGPPTPQAAPSPPSGGPPVAPGPVAAPPPAPPAPTTSGKGERR